jgi:hypothetical protein
MGGVCVGEIDWYVIDDNAEMELCEDAVKELKGTMDIERIED